jgi:hypothetical protein
MDRAPREREGERAIERLRKRQRESEREFTRQFLFGVNKIPPRHNHYRCQYNTSQIGDPSPPKPRHGARLCKLSCFHLLKPTLGTGATTRRHDTTTTMPDPCSESVPPRGGEDREGVLEGPPAFRCRGKMGRVGFDARSFFPWNGRSPVSYPTCKVPFPPRRTGRYGKGMISARPSYRGVRRSVWDPETFAPGAVALPTGRAVSRERLGDWDGPMEV